MFPRKVHTLFHKTFLQKLGDFVAEKYLKNLSFRFRAVLGSKMFQEVSNSINFIQRRQKVWIIMERKTFSFDVVDSVETWKTSTLYVVYMLSFAAIDIIQDSSLPILFHFIAAQVTLQQQPNPNHKNPRNHNFFPTEPFQSSVLIWSKGCFGK